MAFTAKILSWRFRHLNIVGCLLKRRPTKGGGGGSRAPQDPPSYAPGGLFVSLTILFFHLLFRVFRTRSHYVLKFIKIIFHFAIT